MRGITRARILVAVGIVAFVLGVIGYRDVQGHHYSLSDAVFWAISMFSGRLGTIPDATPLALNIGRFMALGVSASVAVTGVILVLRVHWDRWVTERFAAGHTVVVGGSPIAASAGEALCAAGEHVVLLDAEARSKTAVALRQAGARVLSGDAVRPAAIGALRLHRARRAIVLTGSDERNIQVLGAMLSELSGHRHGAPTIHVAVDDVPAWEELSSVSGDVAAPATVSFFNLADAAALALTDALVAAAGTQARTVLIDGSGPVAARLAVHLAERAAGPVRDSEQLTVLVPEDDDTLLHDLRDHAPDVLEAACVRPVSPGDRVDVAVVLHSAVHPSRLARSLALARDETATHVILAAEHHVALSALQTAGVAPDAVLMVPVGVETLVRDLVSTAKA